MGSRVLAGRYELLEKIGEGGMAVVFKAKDRFLDRLVALKILRPEYTTDNSFIESFFRESQLVAGIVDQNIVQVYDVGREGNIYYMVMELVDGEPLSEIIKRNGRLNAHTVVSFAKQIAMALSTAHANHLIHRDIKPHNIMITRDGVAKLTDFGIAKRTAPGQNNQNNEKEAVMGSIHYFSPEQARGIAVDERSDIYSLGIVMYEMITGRVPYDGDSAVDVAVQHMNATMVPPSKYAYEMPQDLEDIILKATAKNPDNRFSNAEDMIMALNFVKYSKLVDYSPFRSDPKPEPDDDYNEEYDDDVEEKPAKRSLTWLAVFLIVFIPLVWGIYDFLAGNMSSANSTVEVPSLYEKSYEDAEKLLKELNLNIAVDTEIVNDKYEPGTILSQTPSEKSVVKPGQTVKVNVTRSSANPVVPDVIEKNIEVAKSNIKNHGLSVGEITEVYSSSLDEGFVISVDPAVGTSLKRGSSVNLVVSKGPNPDGTESFTINVVGMRLEDAIAYIESKGCTCTYSFIAGQTSDVAPGCVISQKPFVYENVKAGEVFSLNVKNEVVDVDGSAVISVDVSGIEDGAQYTLTIVVSDSYKNAGGLTQYSETLTKEAGTDFITRSVTGKGNGTAYSIVGNSKTDYNIDFSTGTVY